MSEHQIHEYTNEIEPLMRKLGVPSLKAYAIVFDIKPARLYKVAKQPKNGVVYDAKTFNWDAVEHFIKRRLDPLKGLDTLEDVVKAAVKAEIELRAKDGRRRSPYGEGAAWGTKIVVDGKMIPKRRFANFEMENGQLVVLKDDKEVYAIIIQTASHTVLRPVCSPNKNEKGEWQFKGNDLVCISNGMLNLRGVGPSALQVEINERFDGTYAKRLADAAAKDAAIKAAEAQAYLASLNESE